MTINSYPLQWPLGWPRTDPSSREVGRFSSKMGGSYSRPVTIAVAVDRVLLELDRMGYPDYMVTISSNLILKNDGLPRSSQAQPADPGVAVYFREYGTEPEDGYMVIPCDKFMRVEQNLAAVAGTVEALRRLDRYGSGIMQRAFSGFEALPNPSGDEWYSVLGVSPDAGYETVEATYKRKRFAAHPDRGGDAETFHRIHEAWNNFTQTQ